MAQIPQGNDTVTLQIRSFLGLHENPDGDTTLKNGELAEMRNFRITKDGHLQVRPGTRTLLSLADALTAAGGDPEGAVFCGVWRGTVGGKEHILASYGGYLWDVDLVAKTAVSKGRAAESPTTFFGFGGKAYLLNGQDYLCWDGDADTTFQNVEGYIPLIQTATTPAGAGTLVESVNRLTGKRRVRFSPDGTAVTFQLPEQGIDEVITVTQTGQAVNDFETNLEHGSITFQTAPKAGTDTVEVMYRKGNGERDAVTGMRYSELFNGATDTRVFLYGDGSNRTIYSGMEYTTGQPSAEYFPDLCEVAVGESNTPLTALVRHYSRLMAYKPNSAWVIQYDTLGLADDSTTAAFTIRPVNRQFGNDLPGQAKLLENDPLTVDVGGVYQWKATSSSGYINGSDSNAKRISDRVARTLKSFDLKQARTMNIKSDHEFWILSQGQALILNYVNDTWYYYRDLPFCDLLEVEGEKYGFAENGEVIHVSRDYHSDGEREIDCYAITGAMDFGRDWQLKYSPMLFVAMQPESGARIYVSVETNRNSDYPEKVVAYSLSTFNHVDFNHFSFRTNRKPQTARVKMKVKKALFYRLIFKSTSASATATILATDIQLRYAGNTK